MAITKEAGYFTNMNHVFLLINGAKSMPVRNVAFVGHMRLIPLLRNIPFTACTVLAERYLGTFS
ncbi:MAG TPA: hypothetical protein VHK70_00130 [Burkholderiaceae bacterium]|jgi:hypothetical protein|nr:hypothetical protein [Burkholderiaceae bacterium]